MDIQAFLYNFAKCMPVLVFAVVAHEVAHGYVALKFGDNTAQRMGRLSFNPVIHADLMGSLVWPILGLALGGVAFGWAKPVPVDPRNFKNYRKGMFWVSFAGPLSNFFIATISALLFALIVTSEGNFFGYKLILADMLNYSILINFILGGFNLIPLMPLDGSKMVASVLKGDGLRAYESIAAYGPQIIMGAFLLSFVGIPVFSYVLMPFQYAGSFLKLIFLSLLS